MKKFLLLLSVCYLFTSNLSLIAAYHSGENLIRKPFRNLEMKDRYLFDHFLQKKDASVVWLPQKSVRYYFMEAGGWEEGESYNYQYENGQLISLETITDESREITLYDKEGRRTETLIQSGSGGNWTNVEKRCYEYDSLVTNLQTKQVYYTWAAGEWNQTYLHRRVVTRNADNEITSSITQLYDPSADSYSNLEKTEITYNEEGVATSVKSFQYDYYAEPAGWVEEKAYTDMVWAVWSGNFWEDMTVLNKLASASMYRNGQYYAQFKVTYSDNGYFSSVGDDTEWEGITYETTDDNGSWQQNIDYYWVEGEGADKHVIKEPIFYFFETYDNHRNLTLSEGYEYDPEAEEMIRVEGMKLTNTYDNEGRFTEEILEVIDPDLMIYVVTDKMVYSDFLEYSDLRASNSDADIKLMVSGDLLTVKSSEPVIDYQVIDLNGRMTTTGIVGTSEIRISTANLAAGIYLVKVRTHEGIICRKFVKK